jgi:hypothetical protein
VDDARHDNPCSTACRACRAEAAEREALLRAAKALERLSARVERHIREQDRNWQEDDACAECVGAEETPSLPAWLKGWRCARHEALAVLATALADPAARRAMEGEP